MEKKCLRSQRALFQGGQVLKTRMEKKEPEEKQEMEERDRHGLLLGAEKAESLHMRKIQVVSSGACGLQ